MNTFPMLIEEKRRKYSRKAEIESRFSEEELEILNEFADNLAGVDFWELDPDDADMIYCEASDQGLL